MSAVQKLHEEKKLEALEELDFKHSEKQQGFHFDEVNHVYTLDGKRMYGTTTVLGVVAKPALIQWSANCAVDHIEEWINQNAGIESLKVEPIELWGKFGEILKEARVAHTKKKESAGTLGTSIHAELEKLIKNAIDLYNGKLHEVILPEDAPEQVREFVQWAIVNDVKFLASEIRLYSRKLFVAGTADFVCEKAGKLYIGDIKTSSAIYDEHFWQASAYAHMAREMGLYTDFHGVVIVNIPRHGGIKVQESYDLKGNFNIFKAAVTIFKGKEARKPKKLKK